MQLSRATLHAHVEGRDLDSYVYGKICEAVSPTLFSHRITRADELTDAMTGGKQVLLRYFDSLRRKKQLYIDFKGVRSAVVFFLDKDLDDLRRIKRRSPHVIYTRSYDLEAEVFREGDIVDAVSAVCSLSPARVRGVGDSAEWRSRCLDAWKDWTEHCVLAQVNPPLRLAGYSSPSQLHDAGNLNINPVKVAQIEARLRAACMRESLDVSHLRTQASRRVNKSYNQSGGYEVFKGKWFPEIIQSQALTHFPTEATRATAFKARLASHVAQTLPMTAPWLDHYAVPLKALMANV